MSTSTVWPSATARLRWKPLSSSQLTIVGGFWAQRQRINRERTIPHGFEQLRQHGTIDNLRLAAGQDGRYQARGDSAGMTLPFLDSDVYKWLEAVGWELGRAADTDAFLVAASDEAIAAVAAAQRDDGYVNSYVQVLGGGIAHRDLAWSHEFYCVGHLIQAAVAWHRALADDRLLTIAVRAADRIDREFGAGGRPGVDGHPCIEMALVELTRVTGDRRYAYLADRMLGLRGQGLLGEGRFGAEYWQDHEPVRTAATVAGHAVRQLYLDCGVVDVAVELDDPDLLGAARCRWDDLAGTRTYLTGGMGSRHRDEAFGDPFELPPDRAYAETCAAIASVMLAWRLLLATGAPEYADAIERAMFNGVLSGISLTGTRFFYTNPLQRRTHRVGRADSGERAPWYECACCPPNLMRLLSTWHQYLATSDDTGIQIHQYATAEVSAEIPAGPVRLAIQTDYPWEGRIAVVVEDAPDAPWSLSLRVPGWCRSAELIGPDGPTPIGSAGMAAITRTWRRSDTVLLDLDLTVRLTEPDPRVDAVRGCVAIERGPLVYCVETADLPPHTELENLHLRAEAAPAVTARHDIGDAIVGVDIPVADRTTPDTGLVAKAIPYFAWANGAVGAMRVWIPR